MLLFTRLIKEQGENSKYSGEIWVITKSGEIISSKKGIFFGSIYAPLEDWEKNKSYLENREGIDLKFLSEDYIQDKTSKKEIDEWREFFLNFGVKEEGDKKKHFGKFGESYAINKLQNKFKTLKLVDEEDRGYDVLGVNEDGKQIYIEVKGRRNRMEEIDEEEIELSPNESKVAGTYKDDFWVCIVTNIPHDPRLFLVQNPSEKGIKLKIAIPKKNWKTFDKDIIF